MLKFAEIPQPPYQRKIPPTPHPGRKPFRPIENIRLDPETPQYHEVKTLRTPTPTPAEKVPTRHHRRRHRKDDHNRDTSQEHTRVAPTPSPNTKEELMLMEQEQELQSLRQGLVMLQRRCEQNRGIVGGSQLEIRVAHLARNLHALRVDNQRLQAYSGHLHSQLQEVYHHIQQRRAQRSRSVSPTRCRLDFNAPNAPRCRSVSPALRRGLPVPKPMPPHPAAHQLKPVEAPKVTQTFVQPPPQAVVPLSLQPILPLPTSTVNPTLLSTQIGHTSAFAPPNPPDPRAFLGEALKKQAETLTLLRQELEMIARPLNATIPKPPPTPVASKPAQLQPGPVPSVSEHQTVQLHQIQPIPAPADNTAWHSFRVIDLTQHHPVSHIISPPKPLGVVQAERTSPNPPRPPSYTRVTSPTRSQIIQTRGPASVPVPDVEPAKPVASKPTVVETSIAAMKSISHPELPCTVVQAQPVPAQPVTRFRFFDNDTPKSPVRKSEAHKSPVRSPVKIGSLCGVASDKNDAKSRRISDGTSSDCFSFNVVTNRLNATIDDLSPNSDVISPRTENTKRSRSPYRSPSAAEISSAAEWLKEQYEAWERPGLSWKTRDAIRRREIAQSAASLEREVTVRRANSRTASRSNTPRGTSGKKSKSKRSKRKKSTKKTAKAATTNAIPAVNSREALWAELRLPVPIFSPSK